MSAVETKRRAKLTAAGFRSKGEPRSSFCPRFNNHGAVYPEP